MKKLGLFIKTSLVAISLMALFSCAGTSEPAETLKFYVGSSRGSLSHSIYLCELDPVMETFAVVDSFAGAKGGSYLKAYISIQSLRLPRAKTMNTLQ